jgi:hypothetical protein
MKIRDMHAPKHRAHYPTPAKGCNKTGGCVRQGRRITLRLADADPAEDLVLMFVPGGPAAK